MNVQRNKKSISRNLAFLLMFLIALIGAVAVYLQYDQKQKYITASEVAFAAQEKYVMSVFERIDSNLVRIRERESMIQQNFSSPENYSNLGPEERIQNEINFIDHLLNENNQMIASLKEELDKKDTQMKGYEVMVRDLKSRITKYQEEANVLLAEKESLQRNLDETILVKNKLAAKVDTLGNEIVQKSAEIKNQKQLLLEKELALHTAYYAIGSYKNLRDSEILQKEGGFLGINRVTTLASNPDTGLFQKIDTREVTKIPVDAKHWEIATGQDPSSYKVEYENDRAKWISITDPKKFWRKTNFLVIVVRENDLAELAASR